MVIGTHPDRTAWLEDCLNTIPTNRQVLIHRPGGYEIAALRTGCASFDRYLFLHDSCLITDPTFWDIIDSTPGPIWLTGGPAMYLGIHHTDRLAPVLATYPNEVDKDTAIRLEVDIMRRLHYPALWPTIQDYNALGTEHRHGRDNLIIGNHLWRKYKATHR